VIPDSGTKRFLIPGTCEALEKTADALAGVYSKLGLSDKKINAMRIAFGEAATNAVGHGHCGERKRKIRVDCRWNPAEVTLVVADRGCGFDWQHVPDPALRENLMKESGRGLHIISSIMSEVNFNEKGNEIRMTLNRGDKSD